MARGLRGSAPRPIAVAGRLGIAATTMEGVLAVKGHGTPGHAGH